MSPLSSSSTVFAKPSIKPKNPCFSSGPCAKRPGWSSEILNAALVGRSHRSKEGKARLNEVILRSKKVLCIPQDWEVGIVPASDTGAVEMVLWALAGSHPMDILSFESFSEAWANDVIAHLQVKNTRVLRADYGKLPDLKEINWAHDVVFVWNGTTSGVCLPSADVIPLHHDGLAICDATSAAFAMNLPWDRLDIVTWSWQKALGGEAAHGMIALSPKAVQRLEEAHEKYRPLPRIFRLVNAKGKIDSAIFEGSTINTPSMLCVEDALDGLKWAEETGGLKALIQRSKDNLNAVSQWVAHSEWAAFLVENASLRSSTSICLKIVSPWFVALDPAQQKVAAGEISKLLEHEKAAFDIASYRDAPAGLRLWGGATVETDDIKAVLPWLDWAHEMVKVKYS